ncbi:hypothetical protein ZWY2020_027132 [Hordeum vulgare]|nr:hypothetical protein ZWY2020_027132 [Hordeum vulgare]
MFARHHTAKHLLVVDDAVAAPTPAMDHLGVDGSITTPITTTSCRTQRPPLDVDHTLATPVTTPSSSCGITSQPTTSSIASPTASTSRRCPPPYMDSVAPPSPRIDKVLNTKC